MRPNSGMFGGLCERLGVLWAVWQSGSAWKAKARSIADAEVLAHMAKDDGAKGLCISCLCLCGRVPWYGLWCRAKVFERQQISGRVWT